MAINNLNLTLQDELNNFFMLSLQKSKKLLEEIVIDGSTE